MEEDYEIYIDPEEDEIFFGCVSDRERDLCAQLSKHGVSSTMNELDMNLKGEFNIENGDNCGGGDFKSDSGGKSRPEFFKPIDIPDPKTPKQKHNKEDNIVEGFKTYGNTSLELEHNYSTPVKQKIDKSILATPKSMVKADKDGGFLKVLSEIALVKAEAEGDKELHKKEDENKENKIVNVIPEIKITEATPEKKLINAPPKIINKKLRRFRIIYNSPADKEKVSAKSIEDIENCKNFKNKRLSEERDEEKLNKDRNGDCDRMVDLKQKIVNTGDKISENTVVKIEEIYKNEDGDGEHTDRGIKECCLMKDKIKLEGCENSKEKCSKSVEMFEGCEKLAEEKVKVGEYTSKKKEESFKKILRHNGSIENKIEVKNRVSEMHEEKVNSEWKVEVKKDDEKKVDHKNIGEIKEESDEKKIEDNNKKHEVIDICDVKFEEEIDNQKKNEVKEESDEKKSEEKVDIFTKETQRLGENKSVEINKNMARTKVGDNWGKPKETKDWCQKGVMEDSERKAYFEKIGDAEKGFLEIDKQNEGGDNMKKQNSGMISELLQKNEKKTEVYKGFEEKVETAIKVNEKIFENKAKDCENRIKVEYSISKLKESNSTEVQLEKFSKNEKKASEIKNNEFGIHSQAGLNSAGDGFSAKTENRECLMFSDIPKQFSHISIVEHLSDVKSSREDDELNIQSRFLNRTEESFNAVTTVEVEKKESDFQEEMFFENNLNVLLKEFQLNDQECKEDLHVKFQTFLNESQKVDDLKVCSVNRKQTINEVYALLQDEQLSEKKTSQRVLKKLEEIAPNNKNDDDLILLEISNVQKSDSGELSSNPHKVIEIENCLTDLNKTNLNVQMLSQKVTSDPGWLERQERGHDEVTDEDIMILNDIKVSRVEDTENEKVKFFNCLDDERENSSEVKLNTQKDTVSEYGYLKKDLITEQPLIVLNDSTDLLLIDGSKDGIKSIMTSNITKESKSSEVDLNSHKKLVSENSMKDDNIKINKPLMVLNNSINLLEDLKVGAEPNQNKNLDTQLISPKKFVYVDRDFQGGGYFGKVNEEPLTVLKNPTELFGEKKNKLDLLTDPRDVQNSDYSQLHLMSQMKVVSERKYLNKEEESRIEKSEEFMSSLNSSSDLMLVDEEKNKLKLAKNKNLISQKVSERKYLKEEKCGGMPEKSLIVLKDCSDLFGERKNKLDLLTDPVDVQSSESPRVQSIFQNKCVSEKNRLKKSADLLMDGDKDKLKLGTSDVQKNKNTENLIYLKSEEAEKKGNKDSKVAEPIISLNSSADLLLMDEDNNKPKLSTSSSGVQQNGNSEILISLESEDFYDKSVNNLLLTKKSSKSQNTEKENQKIPESSATTNPPQDSEKLEICLIPDAEPVQTQSKIVQPVRFSKEAKKIVEVLKKSAFDDTLNFTVQEIDLEDVENSFLSPRADVRLDETIQTKVEVNDFEPVKKSPVQSLFRQVESRLEKESKTTEKERHKFTPLLSRSKIPTDRFFSERRLFTTSSLNRKKCVKKLTTDEKGPATTEKGLQSIQKPSSAGGSSRIPKADPKMSRIPLSGKIQTKTVPEKTPNKLFRNPKFKNIESPINAYINNKPTSLIVNVKPEVKKDFLAVASVRKGQTVSSARKAQEVKSPRVKNRNNPPALPFVEYKSATPFKIEKPSESRLPRLAPTVKKLIGTQSPRILKHEGRFYTKTPRKHVDDNADTTISADPNEVSVVVSLVAQKSNTIK